MTAFGLFDGEVEVNRRTGEETFSVKGPNVWWGLAAAAVSYYFLPEAPFVSKLLCSTGIGVAAQIVGNVGAMIVASVGRAVLGYSTAAVGALVGSLGGLAGTTYFGTEYAKDYLAPKSSMNVSFQQSTTPILKELQAKLKAEKGLVLDIPSRANAPKLSLA